MPTLHLLVVALALIGCNDVSEGHVLKRSSPGTSTVEVLAIVDYSLAQELRSDKGDISYTQYLTGFYDAVNRYFKNFTDPNFSIEVKLTKIHICLTKADCKFLYNAPLTNVEDIRTALHNLIEWAHVTGNNMDTSPFPIKTFDVPIVHTMHYNGVNEAAGFSVVGSPCHDNGIIISDDGHYSALRTAVHELGHLLGAVDDGTEKALTCPETGYVMGKKGRNYLNTFSPCSRKAIKVVLGNDISSCLQTRSGTTIQPISGNEQCRRLYGEDRIAYFQGTSMSCLNLGCGPVGDSSRLDPSQAAEGTTCGGGGKLCVSRKCTQPTFM